MKIEVIKLRDDVYRTDCLDMTGTPPVGVGKSKDEAIGNLFRLLNLEIEGPSGLTWLQKNLNLDIEFIEDETNDEIYDFDAVYQEFLNEESI